MDSVHCLQSFSQTSEAEGVREAAPKQRVTRRCEASLGAPELEQRSAPEGASINTESTEGPIVIDPEHLPRCREG